MNSRKRLLWKRAVILRITGCDYIGLWHKNCSAPGIAHAAYFPKDEITEQKTVITNQYLLPIMYAKDYVKAGRRMLERYFF